jgi:hypothetical protein
MLLLIACCRESAVKLPVFRSGFMFGQPSLCFISPRDSLSTSALSTVVVDWFAHNCAIGSAPTKCVQVFRSAAAIVPYACVFAIRSPVN